jgi:hypothetical protein
VSTWPKASSYVTPINQSIKKKTMGFKNSLEQDGYYAAPFKNSMK